MLDVKKLFMKLTDPLSTVNLVYPVGSIYMSVSATSPAVLFGGTWEQIRDKFLLASGTAHAAGTTGGSETVTLTASQMPSHTHTGPNHNHSLGAHTHTVPAHTHTATTASAGAHTHTVHRWLAAGEGSARWAVQGEETPTVNTSSAGAHTHAVTIAQKAAFKTQEASGNTGKSGTGATGSAGGGTAHNNMPPYLSVYVWKRTA